jgi:hypothetical protein
MTDTIETIETDAELEPVTPKKKKGGARPGAGMPKGKKLRKTIQKEAALARLRQRIYEDTDELYAAAKKEALEKGDTRAIDLLWQRGYGRPTETLDITSGGEKVIGFTYIAPKQDE